MDISTVIPGTFNLFFFITGKGALELERREKVDIQEVTFDFGTLVSENGV